MEKYLLNMKSVALSLSGVPFFKFGLPIITLLGILIFGYFGISGIFKQQTILLYPMRQELSGISTPANTARMFGKVEGSKAILFGIIYVIITFVLIFTLVPLCFYLLRNF